MCHPFVVRVRARVELFYDHFRATVHGRREVGVEAQRFVVQLLCLQRVRQGHFFEPDRTRAKRKLRGAVPADRLMVHTARFSGVKRGANSCRQSNHKGVWIDGELRLGHFQAAAPNLGCAASIDKLRGNDESVTSSANLTFG